MDDQPLALRELRRVLRPGGRLLFIEHVRSNDEKLARWQDRFLPLNVRLGHGCHCNRRTLDTIRGDFSESTWQAFWRSSIDGHATSEIAHDLDLSPAAVCMCRSRVLRRLRETLGELEIRLSSAPKLSR